MVILAPSVALASDTFSRERRNREGPRALYESFTDKGKALHADLAEGTKSEEHLCHDIEFYIENCLFLE